MIPPQKGSKNQEPISLNEHPPKEQAIPVEEKKIYEKELSEDLSREFLSEGPEDDTRTEADEDSLYHYDDEHDDDDDLEPVKSNWLCMTSLGLHDKIDDDLIFDAKLALGHNIFEERIKEYERLEAEKKKLQQIKDRKDRKASRTKRSKQLSSCGWKEGFQGFFFEKDTGNVFANRGKPSKVATVLAFQEGLNRNGGIDSSDSTKTDTSDTSSNENNTQYEHTSSEQTKPPMLSGGSLGGIVEKREANEDLPQKNEDTILMYRHGPSQSQDETETVKNENILRKRFFSFKSKKKSTPKSSKDSKRPSKDSKRKTNGGTKAKLNEKNTKELSETRPLGLQLKEARDCVRKLKQASKSRDRRNSNDLLGEEDIVLLYQHKNRGKRLWKKQPVASTEIIETVLTNASVSCNKSKGMGVNVVSLS